MFKFLLAFPSIFGCIPFSTFVCRLIIHTYTINVVNPHANVAQRQLNPRTNLQQWQQFHLLLPQGPTRLQSRRPQTKIIALPQLHGVRNVSLSKQMQVRTWLPRIVEEQPGEHEVQDQGMRTFPQEPHLPVRHSLQLHPQSCQNRPRSRGPHRSLPASGTRQRQKHLKIDAHFAREPNLIIIINNKIPQLFSILLKNQSHQNVHRLQWCCFVDWWLSMWIFYDH